MNVKEGHSAGAKARDAEEEISDREADRGGDERDNAGQRSGEGNEDDELRKGRHGRVRLNDSDDSDDENSGST